MLDLLISLIVIGLIAGVLTRLVVPGKLGLSILMTTVLGIVGGFLGYLIFHTDAMSGFFQPAGIVESSIGAIIVLLIWTRNRTRISTTRAGVNGRRTTA